MLEKMKYLAVVIWGAFMVIAAWMLGKQTSATAEAQLRLVEAKKRKNEEHLARIEHDAAEANDERVRRRLQQRKEAISGQTQTLTDTQTNLEELLRSRPIDNSAYAREFNRRRAARKRADTEPNGESAA